MKKGDKVTLVGFGTFSVSKRAARTGRNPQTGKEQDQGEEGTQVHRRQGSQGHHPVETVALTPVLPHTGGFFIRRPAPPLFV